jgi:hypothetical protein
MNVLYKKLTQAIAESLKQISKEKSQNEVRLDVEHDDRKSLLDDGKGKKEEKQKVTPEMASDLVSAKLMKNMPETVAQFIEGSEGMCRIGKFMENSR